jgi:putative membrane protein
VACKKTETGNTSTTDTGATSASDTYGTTSSTGTSATSTTSTTSTTATNTATAPLEKSDQEFLTKAAEGGIAEVNLGQLAAAKATAPDVKAFGNLMVTDHGRLNDELKALAQKKGVTLPTGPGKEGEETFNKLSAKNGKDFDKAYIDAMVKDHEKDVKEFEKASKEAKDPDVKAWAATSLPVIQNHLHMAKDIKKNLK